MKQLRKAGRDSHAREEGGEERETRGRGGRSEEKGGEIGEAKKLGEGDKAGLMRWWGGKERLDHVADRLGPFTTSTAPIISADQPLILPHRAVRGPDNDKVGRVQLKGAAGSR